MNKISKYNLINILVFTVCALVSAVLFVTTLNKELKSIEERQWKTK